MNAWPWPVAVVMLSSALICSAFANPPISDTIENLTLMSRSRQPTPRAVDARYPPVHSAAGDRHVRLFTVHGLLLARGSINGEPVGYFIVDTGSNGTLINKPVAERLNLTMSKVSSVKGLADQQVVNCYKVDSMHLGSVRLETKSVAAVDLSRLERQLRRRLAGVVGITAFDSSPFTLDCSTGELVIHDRSSFEQWREGRGPGESYREVRGLPLLSMHLQDGTHVDMLLDTGAAHPLTLPADSRVRWPKMFEGARVAQSGHSYGLSGKVKRQRTVIREVTLLGEQHARLAVDLEDVPADLGLGAKFGIAVVGRVGTGVLRNYVLTFDPANQRLWAQKSKPSVRRQASARSGVRW